MKTDLMEDTNLGHSKSNLYCFQFSWLYGDEIYLPYSVGILWAYARTISKINNNMKHSGFRGSHTAERRPKNPKGNLENVRS